MQKFYKWFFLRITLCLKFNSQLFCYSTCVWWVEYTSWLELSNRWLKRNFNKNCYQSLGTRMCNADKSPVAVCNSVRIKMKLLIFWFCKMQTLLVDNSISIVPMFMSQTETRAIHNQRGIPSADITWDIKKHFNSSDSFLLDLKISLVSQNN